MGEALKQTPARRKGILASTEFGSGSHLHGGIHIHMKGIGICGLGVYGSMVADASRCLVILGYG